MSNPEITPSKIRWPIRSLLVAIAFLGLATVALIQHRQNLKLQHRLETLSSRIEHLNAADDMLRTQQGQLMDLVRTEPVLKLRDVLNQDG